MYYTTNSNHIQRILTIVREGRNSLQSFEIDRNSYREFKKNFLRKKHRGGR